MNYIDHYGNSSLGNFKVKYKSMIWSLWLFQCPLCLLEFTCSGDISSCDIGGTSSTLYYIIHNSVGAKKGIL